MKSVRTNYILNLINTGSQILFPLLTFPYASRIMQPEGIGEVNFLNSIVSYISLFTCLGIPTYAIREIARVRNNTMQMNKIATEILLLHAVLTLLGYLIVVILCILFPKIQTNIPLFLILSSGIFFTAIGCEWFYQGIEDFAYVTIRGIIIRILSIFFLYLFVKEQKDLLLYGVYTIFGSVGGNLFNILRLRKYIKKENIIFSQLEIKKHIKPTISVFTFSIITSLYLQLNPLLLGIIKDAVAVGYFVTSTKLMEIVLRLSNCLSAVIMPRITNLIAENNIKEFKALSQKAYNFVIAITIPLTIVLIYISPYAVKLLAGESFAPAILSAQIIAPNIFLVGLSQVMGYQVLYPMGKLRLVIICTGIGAITNIILNILLVPNLSHYGTAISYLGAEMATTISMMIIAHKHLPIKLYYREHTNYIVGGIIIVLILTILQTYFSFNNITMITLLTISSFIFYLGFLYIRKDKLLISVIKIKK